MLSPLASKLANRRAQSFGEIGGTGDDEGKADGTLPRRGDKHVGVIKRPKVGLDNRSIAFSSPEYDPASSEVEVGLEDVQLVKKKPPWRGCLKCGDKPTTASEKP